MLLPLVMANQRLWLVALAYGAETVGSTLAPFALDFALERWVAGFLGRGGGASLRPAIPLVCCSGGPPPALGGRGTAFCCVAWRAWHWAGVRTAFLFWRQSRWAAGLAYRAETVGSTLAPFALDFALERCVGGCRPFL